jgi:hypothetical protein
VLAQITWYHNIALIEKLQTAEDRAWYARATVEHGWSRNILVHQIESALHQRQGKAVIPPNGSRGSEATMLGPPHETEIYGFFRTFGAGLSCLWDNPRAALAL